MVAILSFLFEDKPPSRLNELNGLGLLGQAGQGRNGPNLTRVHAVLLQLPPAASKHQTGSMLGV